MARVLGSRILCGRITNRHCPAARERFLFLQRRIASKPTTRRGRYSMRETASAVRIDSSTQRAGLALLAGALMAVALALATAAPSSAASRAQIGEIVKLRFPSTAGPSACVGREIRLDAGNYDWRAGHGFAGWNAPVWEAYRTTGPIPAGKYSWTDCVSYETYGGGYAHKSSLVADGFSIRLGPYSIRSYATGMRDTWYGSQLW
jgi:hypothetical protein